MSKLFGNDMERWVHAQLHKIADETNTDVDKVAEIIDMFDDARDLELINEKDASLFDTLVNNEDCTATDEQFLTNLAQWIINWNGNVNVAQRLNIISISMIY